MIKTLELWTDGSCKKNGQKGAYGGWAAVVVDKDTNCQFRACGREEATTNNIMEMKAMINGLEVIKTQYGDNVKVVVYSDSAYILNCYNQRWYDTWIKNGWKNAKREKVKNKELWETLIPFFESPLHDFQKVTGHAGVAMNEMVDTLAQCAADNMITLNLEVPISDADADSEITWILFKEI